MQAESMHIPPRLPLVVLPANRNASVNKDARLVNCYIETNEHGEIQIYRRPGIVFTAEHSPPAAGLGCFAWAEDSDLPVKVYSIFGDTLYQNDVLVENPVTLNGAKKVYWNSYLGATPKMIFGDGEYAYTWEPVGGLSAELHSINVEYPDVTVKGFAYLNGATYVMQPAAVIWGSAINSVDQVGDWDPLNFISAQAEPDYGVFMSKQLVYVIAGNQWTTEVFFDAGNPTGSPLGPVQGSLISYGCASADSLQKIDDVLFWLCTNRSASPQIAMVKQLGLTIISTKSIDKLLEDMDPLANDVMSWQAKFNGHSFYVITIPSINLTLAYDIVEDLWSQWTDTNGNYLKIVDSTYDSENNIVLQHHEDGCMYRFVPDSYVDADGLIPVHIITPTFDAQTRSIKQNGRMTFVADQVPGSTLQVRWTDDDYQTWSNYSPVDLGAEEPILTDCGSFVKRAFDFHHMSNEFFRISAVEIQYDLGTL